MTTEQMLALPDTGVDYELIRGVLKNRGTPLRGYRHTAAATCVLTVFGQWIKGRPEPAGVLLGPGATFRIATGPDTTVAVDVALVSADLPAATDPAAMVLDGLPTVAVEILSPGDTQADVAEKVQAYLDAGVPLTWVAEPVFRTVTVYRPDAEPTLYNAGQRIDGEPHLPGFAAAVADLFEPVRRRR